MDSQKIQLIQGTILHDIGKVILRAGTGEVRNRHSILGADEIEKIEDRTISPKIGFVYQPITALEIRLSTDFMRTMAGWGMGYRLKHNTLMTSYTYHRDLGGLLGISLQWMK